MNLDKPWQRVFITVCVIGFSSYCYLAIQMLTLHLYHSLTPHYRTALDLAIPFVPELFIIYATLPAVIIITAYRIHSLQFKRLLLSACIMQIIAYSCFLLWPSQLERPDPSLLSGFWHEILQYCHSWDQPLNNNPSLHVSYSMLMVQCLGRQYRIIYVWSLCIVLSVLFVKQHTVLDIVGGLFLAYFSWWVSGHFFPSQLGTDEIISTKSAKGSSNTCS